MGGWVGGWVGGKEELFSSSPHIGGGLVGGTAAGRASPMHARVKSSKGMEG